MKMPSALDITIVIVVMTMAQVFLSTVPEAQGWWWAPGVSAALLAGVKLIQVNWPSRQDPAAPGAAAQASAQLMAPESKVKRFLVD